MAHTYENTEKMSDSSKTIQNPTHNGGILWIQWFSLRQTIHRRQLFDLLDRTGDSDGALPSMANEPNMENDKMNILFKKPVDLI